MKKLIVLCLFLASSCAAQTFSFVREADSGTTYQDGNTYTSICATWPSNGSADLGYITANWQNTSAGPAATDADGNSYTSTAGVQTVSSGNYRQSFYVPSLKAATGNNQFCLGWSGGNTAKYAMIIGAEYSVSSGSFALDQSGTANGNGSSNLNGASVTTTKAPELLIGTTGDSWSTSVAGTGWNLRSTISGGEISAMLEDQTQSATGTYQMTLGGGTGSTWGSGLDTFYSSGGGGGSAAPTPLNQMGGIGDLLVNVTPTFGITTDVTQLETAAENAAGCTGAGCSIALELCGPDAEGDSVCLHLTPATTVDLWQENISATAILRYIVGQMNLHLPTAILQSGQISP